MPNCLTTNVFFGDYLQYISLVVKKSKIVDTLMIGGRIELDSQEILLLLRLKLENCWLLIIVFYIEHFHTKELKIGPCFITLLQNVGSPMP